MPRSGVKVGRAVSGVDIRIRGRAMKVTSPEVNIPSSGYYWSPHLSGYAPIDSIQ